MSIIQGAAALTACPALDGDHNGIAIVGELVGAVGQALNGCRCLNSGSIASTPSLASFTLTTSVGPLTFDIFNVSGSRGATGSFPIVTTHTGRISGFNVDLLYPANVLTTPACALNTSLVPDTAFGLSFTQITPGRLRVLLVPEAPVLPLQTFAQGPILTCSAQVLGGAPLGTFPLTAERLMVSDSSAGVVPATIDNGTIEVTSGGCTVVPPGSGDQAFALLLVPLALVARRWLRHLVGALVLLGWAASPANSQALPRAANGTWLPDESMRVTRSANLSADASSWRWYVSDLRRDGFRIRGNFAITGGAFLSSGTFDGGVDPKTGSVQGSLIDTDGNHVATLSGSVTREGIKGRIATTRGESFHWSWTSPNPGAWATLSRAIN